jgi:hypothetical protein
MMSMMIEAALRALVFAIAVGAGLRVLRVKNVPVRKAAWSVVLIASLAMPLLMRWSAATELGGRFAWVVPIRLKQLVATRPHAAVPVTPVVLVSAEGVQDSSPDIATASTAISASTSPEVIMAAPETTTVTERGLRWPPAARLIEMVYLAVAGALLLRLFWGLGAALRLWMTAELVSPLIAPEPNVRSSAKIPSPVTIGSGIVLPANYTAWDRKKLRMVLAHERSHVRQLDFYLQVLAGIYTALFWFSPLGWWLRRTLCSLGEAIGDRAGIDAAASRSGYAEVLLEFAAMPRQTLPGVAMARTGNLSRRIERLLNEHLFRSAFAEGRRRALVSLLLIPVALFAATVLIRVPGASAQTAPAPATAPATATTPDSQAALMPVQDQTAPPLPAAPAAAPTEPTPPNTPPAAPPALGESEVRGVLADGNSATVHGPGANIVVDGDDILGYAYHFSEDGDSYAVISGSDDDNISFSGRWSGDRREELDAARKVAKGPFLWFTHDGKSYIVDDPAIVTKIRGMYKPMEDLGQQQEALGRQQEELGRQQEELGQQQEQAATVRVPDLSKEMAQIDAALTKLKAEQGKEMSQEKLGEMQEKLSEMQSRLGELQGEAGRKQGEFGGKMGELGARQGALGAEQGRLGAEQGRLARQADQQVRSIIDESLRTGKAKRLQNVD